MGIPQSGENRAFSGNSWFRVWKFVISGQVGLLCLYERIHSHRNQCYLLGVYVGNSKPKVLISLGLICFIMKDGHLPRSMKYFRLPSPNTSGQCLLIRAYGTILRLGNCICICRNDEQESASSIGSQLPVSHLMGVLMLRRKSWRLFIYVCLRVRVRMRHFVLNVTDNDGGG